MTKDLKVTGENAVRKLCVDEARVWIWRVAEENHICLPSLAFFYFLVTFLQVLEVLEGPVEEEELKVRNQFFNSQNMFIVLTVRGATRQSSLHFR